MMPDDGSRSPFELNRLSARAIALRTALMASAVFIVAALVAPRTGWWAFAVAALAALALAVGLFRDRRPLRDRMTRSTGRAASALPSLPPVLAAIPDPIILVDRRGVVITANPAARAALPALKAAQPLSFALRAPDVLGGIDAALKSGEAQKVEFVERVPVERAFAVHVAPVVNPVAAQGDDGAPARAFAVLFFRDLTPARRLETIRVDFVANASHELRTPLASVLGFIETLQGPARNDAPARERFLAIMREQAQRMARLIDDLLSLSRIELKAHLQPQTPLDLVAIVRHMIETLSPLAREKGVEISLDAPALPVVVRGERDELLRVFENLIENAVKYGRSGGKVDVGIAPVAILDGKAAEVVVSVRDYGPGIAPEHLPRLTERFYRVDVAASRESGGTGLGLAIVKHIVNRHRGRLSIVSETGDGAQFRVFLPLVTGVEADRFSRVKTMG